MGRKQPAERQIGERERAGGEVASCHPVRKEYFLFMYLFYYSSYISAASRSEAPSLDQVRKNPDGIDLCRGAAILSQEI